MTAGFDTSPVGGNRVFCGSLWGGGYLGVVSGVKTEYRPLSCKKRAEGKHYNVAISHAAKKLVRLIYAMEKSGQSYRKSA